MASSNGALRVLSLDGGGIRGLSAIMILKIIMEEVNEVRKNRGEPVVEPYEYFDMIGGTSTGGIIAVMLGRLHMTLDQCEEAYTKLGQKIFEPKYSGLNPRRGIDRLMANEKFDSSVLEAAIKEVIAKNSEGSSEETNNALLMEEDAKCKVLVCALDSRNANPIFLRNFRSQKADLVSRDIKIWEACRATSAATTFFDPFFFEKRQMNFVDGALMYNNPVRRVHEEAGQLWSERRERMVLISIGTGDSPRIKLEGNLVKIAEKLAELVTGTQQVADDFTFEHPEMAGTRYFRFNATGMEEIGLEEYKEIPGIFGETQRYLQGATTSLQTKACVKALRLSDPRIPNEKQLRDIQALIYEYLQDPYAERKHVVPEPVDNTCTWLLSHRKFLNWKDKHDPTVLWVTANAGCGKSVLAKFLVDNLDPSRTHRICYFFFSGQMFNINHAFWSIIHQMIPLLPYGIESRVARELWGHFKTKKTGLFKETGTAWDIICLANADGARPELPIICIVDGLDECTDKCPNGKPHGCSNECPGRSRSYFIAKLAQLNKTTTEKTTATKFLITSRPDPQIEAGFNSMSEIRLRLEEEENHTTRDVSLVIKAGVDKLITGSSDYEEEDRDFLVEKMMYRSGQTFLWIDLVLRELENATYVNKDKMDEIIRTGPPDLDKRYEDELGHSKDPEGTRRVLQLIIGSRTPLSLSDLNIAFKIGPEALKVEEITLERNMERVVKMLCGFLVRISHGRVYLFHETTREFLVNSRSTNWDSKTWKHSIDLSVASCALATSCARYLLLQDWREPFKVPTSWLEACNAADSPHLDSTAETVEIEWFYILPHVLDLPGFEDSFFQYALQTLPDLAPGIKEIEHNTEDTSPGILRWLKVIDYLKSMIWRIFTLSRPLHRKAPDVDPHKPDYPSSYWNQFSSLQRSGSGPPDITNIETWLQSVGESDTIPSSRSHSDAQRNYGLRSNIPSLLENEQIVVRSLDFYKLPRPYLWYSISSEGTHPEVRISGERQFNRGVIMLSMLQNRIGSARSLESNPNLSVAFSRALEAISQARQRNPELERMLDPFFYHWIYNFNSRGALEDLRKRGRGSMLSRLTMNIRGFIDILEEIRTPLITNLVKGNEAIVRRLLDDPSLQSEHELLDDIITALTWRSDKHDSVLIRTVLNLRRKYCSEVPENHLLQEAIKWKRFCLLPLYTMQERTDNDDTSYEIVIQALAEGHVENEEEFLRKAYDSGLKFTALGLHQNIALHLCLGMCPTDSIVRAVGLLLKRGINPNYRDAAGNSPLDIMTVLAPTKESAAIVGLLVEYGANVNEQGPNGRIPLQNTIAYSVSEDLVKTAEYLLSNASNAKAIDLADLRLSGDLFLFEKLIEILVHKNANGKRESSGKPTILHKLAALPDSQELLRIIDSLIWNGRMDPNILDGNGKTPLEFGKDCHGIRDEDLFNGSASLTQGLAIFKNYPIRMIGAPEQEEIIKAYNEDMTRLEGGPRRYSSDMDDVGFLDLDNDDDYDVDENGDGGAGESDNSHEHENEEK